MTTFTPTPPVRFCITRLRQSVAETSRFSDDDLAGYINDGYQSACERSACLPAVTTITLAVGTVEASVPTDWARTLRIYLLGDPLNPTAYQDAISAPSGGYYQYGTLVGVTGGAVTTTTTLWLLYARYPAVLTLESTPEWGGEWNYLLRHYAAWRCLTIAGGAEDIRRAGLERTLFDAGVNKLRGQTNRSAKSAPAVVRTLLNAR